jgi:glyoxylase-like metal-dependent hydrolase (beta-lactamase superfamily II)
MVEVKILVEGYTTDSGVGGSEEERTASTITLIRDGNNIIVVDPGVLKSQSVLIDALKKEGLTVDDVNVVFLTHSHIDHFRNVGMFPNAKLLEFFGLWENDTVDDWEEQFSENIKIIKTPGHADNSLSFLIKTDKGLVAIVGDVFWKKDFPEKDPYANDLEKLAESRKKVLELADYIIPGHGKMFKVEK